MLKQLLLLMLLSASPAEVKQSTCPAPDEVAHRRAMIYLTHPGYAEDRQPLGLDGYPPAQVRVLTDATDLAMCQRLVAQFGVSGSHPNWHWSAYKIGSYYLVSWRWESTDGSMRLGLTPWIIVDENLSQYGGFAS